MGPIIIYDKSVLQCLNSQEADCLHKIFLTNITPVLSLEVLADLKESPRFEGMTAEQFVACLANKMPTVSSHVNAEHISIVRGELLGGGQVPMRGQIIESQMPTVVQANDGRTGLHYCESEEEKALALWKDGRFSEFDNLLAEQWKETQKSLDLGQLASGLRNQFKDTPRFKNLTDLKAYIDHGLNTLSAKQPYGMMKLIVGRFIENEGSRIKVLRRWKHASEQANRYLSPQEFAPYAYYLYSVEFFYIHGLAQDLISSAKKSKSHIDMQYLFYLPFCMTFISNDAEHQKMVPHFLRPDQNFINGMDLKRDLARIVAAKQVSGDQDKKGGIKPTIFLEEGSIVGKIYDFHFPNWRKKANLPEIKLSPEEEKKVVSQLNFITRDAVKKGLPLTQAFDQEGAQFLVKERHLTRTQMKKEFGISDEEFDKIIEAQNKNK